MSKRYTGEEWSDDDIDGSSLSGSPPKRRRNSPNFESRESSESGFFSRTINRIYSSVNNLFKGFNLSSDEQRMNCESVRSQSSLGMNQTNDIYSLDIRSEEPMLQSNQYITLTSAPNQTNYVLIQQNPSPQTSAQILTHVPIQFITTNTSPNPLVVLSTSSAHNMNQSLKCLHCGQVSSSPITQCRHCNVNNSKNANRINVSQGIVPKQFYASHTNSGIGRARPSARMQMSSSSMIGVTPNKPTISNVRSLSGAINTNNSNNGLISNQRLYQLSPKFVSKPLKNPELIELDAENVEKRAQRLSQELNDDCIEIMESNETEDVSGVGVQCDINSETNSSKTRSIEQNHSQTNKKIMVSNNDSNEESLENMTTLPDYTMFGTYKTFPKAIEFIADGIKLTNVSANSNDIKFKYHVMIPFVEIQELFYYSGNNNSLLFIKPTLESNQKIQESMHLGSKSTNGLRFDIKSEDSREHYIIAVLKEKMSDKFSRILQKFAKRKNSDIKCDPIEADMAKHLLEAAIHRAPQRVCVINSSNSMLQTPPKRSNPYSRNRNLFKSSDSSDTSPSPLRSCSGSRRSYLKTPVQTIIIDIDDDDEAIIETKDEFESEFDKVILSYPEDDKNAIHLVGTDIKCLNKGEFLNDNIVNFYLRYFFNEKLDEEKQKTTHIFDTLFFIQLTEKRPAKRKNSLGREEQYTFEQRYEQKLKKWTKNIDIFSKDFLVFPIIKESHWFLSIVCYPSAVHSLQQKTDNNSPKIKSEETEDLIEESPQIDKKPCIIFMDSLGNASYKKTLSTPIRDFLAQEWKSRHNMELSFKTAKVMRDFSPHVPNQTNSSDCGLFVLEYVEQFLECPEELVKKLFENHKHALIEWFENDVVKPKRQNIRNLIFDKVSPQLKERLETLIDDTKLSDSEDNDEIGMEVMNTSVDESKVSSPETNIL